MKRFGPQQNGQYLLAAVSQRADHDMFAVIAHQFGGILSFSAIEHTCENRVCGEYRRDGGPVAILVAPSSVAVRYRCNPRRKRERQRAGGFLPESLSQCRRCFFDDFIFYAQLLM